MLNLDLRIGEMIFHDDKYKRSFRKNKTKDLWKAKQFKGARIGENSDHTFTTVENLESARPFHHLRKHAKELL